MTHVICEPCICFEDGSCVVVCPVDAIHPGVEHHVIDPQRCIDCGACVPACPMSAVFREERVPKEWRVFIERNQSESRRRGEGA